MRTRVTVLFAVLSVAAAGCRLESSAPEGAAAAARASGDVTASRVAEGVQVTNGTNRPVAYAVWNRGWLALFGPCTDTGPECPRLAPGQSVVVPLSAIAGYAAGAQEASVRWWHVIAAPNGGYQADEVREVIVPL